MTTVAIVVALVLQQVSPSASVDGKPGLIRGRISAADSGKPLVRANVMVVSASDAPALRLTANTNARGMFEVRDVPPGQYNVFATRAGYLRLQYGQRRANDLGMTVDVAAGAEVERIDVALPKGGVLSGRITDELGEPYPGVRVDALGTHYDHGRRVPFPEGVATTDDLGQYRISGLPSGNYYVVAASTETWLTDKKEMFGYASTYYPGGPAEVAQIVALATSQQRTNLDFSLHASRAARIRGRVTRENGDAASGATIMLAYSYPGIVMVGGSRLVRTERDGTFEIKDVPGGVYVVGGGSASQTVTMNGSDVDGIVLTPKTGSTVTGTFVTEDGSPPPFPSAGVRVLLVPPDAEKVLPTVRVVSADRDWGVKFENLGGPFLFRATGLPDGWVLSSVRLDEREVTDTPWDVPTGGKHIEGLKFVLSQKTGRVSGTVADAQNAPTSGATVVLFAEDDKLWMPGSRFLRSTRPDRNGRFSFAGVPAGTYRVIVREFVEAGEWEDRAFLESARDQAQRLIVAEGGRETLTLKLAAAR